MNARVIPLRCVLGAVAAGLFGAAAAQSPLSEAQTRYMGAYVFDRQMEVFRRYCAPDATAAAALELGLARFRAANPDYVAALRTRPAGADFVAGVEAFDVHFDGVARVMQQHLASEAPAARCPTLARHLGDMRFARMIEEATRGAAAASIATP